MAGIRDHHEALKALLARTSCAKRAVAKQAEDRLLAETAEAERSANQASRSVVHVMSDNLSFNGFRSSRQGRTPGGQKRAFRQKLACAASVSRKAVSESFACAARDRRFFKAQRPN